MKPRGSPQRKLRVSIPRLARVLAVAAASGACSLRGLVNDGAAIAAKTLCSGVYVAHRGFEDVLAQDVRPISPVMRNLHTVRAPDEAVGARLTVPVIGSAERVARHRPGLGCVLEPPTPGAMVSGTFDATADTARSDGSSGEWPHGEAVDLSSLPSSVNTEKLRSALDQAFAGGGGRESFETRAIVIVHRGRIIAERYAAGFGPTTPLPGWSMAKSVLNALIGIRVHDGGLALDTHDLHPAWNRPGDTRRKITVEDLLYMRSGLRFEESYGSGRSDVRRMLFHEADMAGFAASQPLEHDVGTHWAYSSGTANLLSWALRRSFESDEDYWRFPRRALFGPLGIRSAVIEADASGTFVASSYLYASARDWARFGLLYLNDGVWNGVRILPPGWVRRSAAPAPGLSGPQAYGMQWWLVLSDANVALGREPALPAGSFFARGHWGQHIAVIPSHDLVVVRLGWTIDESEWDPAAFTARVVEAVRQ